MYYNYHAKIKNLIKTNHLTGYKFVEKYHNISPALVLIFDCHTPMPIRKHKWEEYKLFLLHFGINLQIPNDETNNL